MTFPAGIVSSARVAPAGGYTHPNLKGHWDASTLAGTAGTAISTWTDLTGTADMTQGTTSARPTVQPATLNGLTVARFDATDDYMASAPRVTSNQTLALVRKVTGTGTSVQMWNGNLADLGAGTTHGGGPIIISSNRALYVRGVGIPSDGAHVPSAWERWIIRMGVGINSLHVNGTQVISAVTTMNPVTLSNGVSRLGGSDNGGGSTPEFVSGGMDLAQAMIFDAVLDTTEVATLDAHLKTKWGL